MIIDKRIAEKELKGKDKTYPEIFRTVCGKSELLLWSHYRLLQYQNKSTVETEMKEKSLDYQNDKREFIKNPIIAKFMGLSANTDMTESDFLVTVAGIGRCVI